jgi:ferredoxin
VEVTPVVSIDADKCTACGMCATVCPSRVFARDDHLVVVQPAMVPGCAHCGHCMGVCPTEAVSVDGFDYSDFRSMPGLAASADDLAALLSRRRTTRRFKPDPVPREVLDRLLSMAATAPAGVPPSTVEVTVATERDKIAQLAPAAIEQLDSLRHGLRTPILGSLLRRSVGRGVVDDLERHYFHMFDAWRKHIEETGDDMITWGAPVVLAFHAPPGLCPRENSLIALAYATLAAEALGLGSCVSGFVQAVLERNTQLRDLFAIPEAHSVHGVLLTGYPAWRPFRRTIPRAFAATHWV